MNIKSQKGCEMFKGSCCLSSGMRRFKLGGVWAIDVALGVVTFSFHICFSGEHTLQSSGYTRPQQL